MKYFLLITAALLISSTSVRAASESCEQMRDRIIGQASAKGVKNPQVRVETKGARLAPGEKQVAHCGQGKSIIVYRKN